jgi:hypothetical protein
VLLSKNRRDRTAVQNLCHMPIPRAMTAAAAAVRGSAHAPASQISARAKPPSVMGISSRLIGFQRLNHARILASSLPLYPLQSYPPCALWRKNARMVAPPRAAFASRHTPPENTRPKRARAMKSRTRSSARVALAFSPAFARCQETDIVIPCVLGPSIFGRGLRSAGLGFSNLPRLS